MARRDRMFSAAMLAALMLASACSKQKEPDLDTQEA